MRKLVAFCALSLWVSTALAEEAMEAPAAPAEVSSAEPAAEMDSSTAEASADAAVSAPAAPEPKKVAPSAPAPKTRPGAGSPALALVARGDAAFVARDIESACAAYQGAALLDPKAAVAHMRLAECQVALGKLDDAVASSEQALRVVEPGSRLQLVALSRQSAIFETRGDFDKAVTTYKMLVTAAVAASDAPARTLFERVARERSMAIETRKKELADSAIVKARIDEELADAAPKNSSGAPAIVPSKSLVL